MEFFLDTASVEEIIRILPTGFISGVTTNPSLLAQQKAEPFALLKEICTLIKGPISIEVTTETALEMIMQAHEFMKIAPHVVIKVPLTLEGLKACRELRQEGISVNVTLCFSLTQALLAAKAGASYVSPFIGRLDDIGASGKELIQDIVALYKEYGFSTKVLAASLRNLQHVKDACQAGAHIATLPPRLFYQLHTHPLTTQGLAAFDRDWKALIQ